PPSGGVVSTASSRTDGSPTEGSGSGAGAGTAVASGAPDPAAKSSSTIRHQLKQAEKALAAAQRRHAELSDALVSISASGDHVRLTELGADLATAEADMGAAEETWLELAAEAEERGLKV